MGSSRFMTSAIRSANKLRTALGTKVTGSYTVSPHTALNGGLVAVYLSDRQADELTDAIKDHRSPVRQEWLEGFFLHYAMDGSGDIVLGHWIDDKPCPDKWEKRLDGENLCQVNHLAHEHQEVCGK